jgi:N-acetyl-anhydromuramyl-L-alanine amidase AmpD
MKSMRIKPYDIMHFIQIHHHETKPSGFKIIIIIIFYNRAEDRTKTFNILRGGKVGRPALFKPTPFKPAQKRGKLT